MSPPAASAEDRPPPPRRGRRVLRWIGIALLLLVIGVVATLWFGRERLADRAIGDYLEEAGVRATYEVEEIGPQRQVLRNLVIGDPARPDLTVERVEIFVRPRLGLPGIDAVRLVRPRLFATLRGGAISFGALDPLVFTGSKEPFSLPALDLAIEDGRALLEGDYGPVGLSLSGSGLLRDGFAGELAATGPRLLAGGCVARGASLYGTLAVENAHPKFTGPLRLDGLDCPAQGLAAGATVLPFDLTATPLLDRVEVEGGLQLAALNLPNVQARALSGPLQLTWRAAGEPAFALRYGLTGEGLSGAGIGLSSLGLEGTLRASRDFARVDSGGALSGRGLAPGSGLDRRLASLAAAGAGTLAQPLVAKLRRAIATELPGSTLFGEYDLRLRDGGLSLAVPDARLRGRGGATLLALSRVLYAADGAGLPRLSGNFSTGGAGLPQLSGRLEQRGADAARIALRLAPYREGDSLLEIPQMSLVQRGDGALGFAGEVLASGPLPGGAVRGLRLPVSGNLGAGGALSVWRGCTPVRFESLALADLALDRRALTLCPPSGRAIVQSGPRGWSLAAGVPALELAGRLGETPIRLSSGPVGFAWPGNVSARQVRVSLGPADTATEFAVEDLTARIGADISGTFGGTDVKLAAVPLDLLGAGGTWSYAGGRFAIADSAFRLEDRQKSADGEGRFRPLVARGASLALQNNLITALATLREPKSDRAVADVAIRHDLTSAGGSADLAVAGLLFDRALQPDDLTVRAKGLVANVAGTVTGSGRIDWDAASVTSSGTFKTDSLDLAAAFGPVKGVSGTIVFTDLLALTTAPGQEVRIASINPGIEVSDGLVTYRLVDGTLLQLGGGRWPFLGGTLELEPLEMRFGNAETRRYVLQIEGLEAARLIEQMELTNLAVTGTFDGTVPVVFDAEGNGRLEGGMLVSRPPGGNLSYVGQLTYEDMGAIPNFAFQALRSLDFTKMAVQMDGSLVGEIVTKVRLDGVSQGAGARRNFITRRIASLPIRLDVNVRAPFYSLIGTLRRTYDPSYIPDPRSLGIVGSDGRALPPGERKPPSIDFPPIQPSESEVRP